MLRRYAESLNFLSGTATGMLEKLGSPELFRFISESLYKVAGGAIITFSEFDVLNKRLIVKEFQCTGEEKEKTIKILGRLPEGLAFDFPEEIRERIKPAGLNIWRVGFMNSFLVSCPWNFVHDWNTNWALTAYSQWPVRSITIFWVRWLFFVLKKVQS
ncbi:MAG: hypothetical protein HC906_09195 [Bacteroidales bacterium]|nr:hypothetical protein [Bacteroidales bacterium]